MGAFPKWGFEVRVKMFLWTVRNSYGYRPRKQ